MIRDKEKTIQTIKDWICDYAEKNGKSTLIVIDDSSNGFELLKKVCLSQTKFKFEIPSQECIATKYLYTLLTLAKNTNGIILSTLNKTQFNLIRAFQKYGTHNMDIFPLIDLYESEISSLLGVTQYNTKHMDFFILDIEWAQEENKKYGIIENDELPQHTSNWFKYTLPQKELISKLHQREKQTRHKNIVGRPMLKF